MLDKVLSEFRDALGDRAGCVQARYAAGVICAADSVSATNGGIRRSVKFMIPGPFIWR